MTRSVGIPEEARAAGLAALHADPEWHRADEIGVWRANYKRAVELVLEAALPYLAPAVPQPVGRYRFAWLSARRRASYAAKAFFAEARAARELEAAVPQPVDREALMNVLHSEKHGDRCTFTNRANCDRWHDSIREADAVLALLNDSEVEEHA